MTIEVTPATPDRWPDVEAVFGVRGDPSRCWCQYFRLRGKAWSDAEPRGLRESLRSQLYDDPPPGAIAYDDGEPAGWCATAPRASYPRVLASPNWRSDAGPATTWVVTCFVVRPGHRRRGIAAALLTGALDLATAHGGTAAEACAVDTTESDRIPSADLYRGPLSVYLAAGFTVVRRSSPAWVLVRRPLGDPA